MSGKARKFKKDNMSFFCSWDNLKDRYFKMKLKCYRSQPIRLRKFDVVFHWIISYFQRKWVQLTLHLFLGEFVLMIKRKREFLIEEKSIFWHSIRINVSEAQLKCSLCFFKLFVEIKIMNLKRRFYQFVIKWCCYIGTKQFSKVLPFISIANRIEKSVSQIMPN